MPIKKVKKVATKTPIDESIVIPGFDTAGNEYDSLQTMWESEIGNDNDKRQTWYKQGVDYWIKTEASVDGVLGGFGHISRIDIAGSKDFLLRLPRVDFTGPAADCGGGIGRISKDLLCPLFSSVDLIDPTPPYIAKAKELMADVPTMGRFYEMGLEAWEPDEGYYSVIWCQWVLPYIIDDDLVHFLKRCIKALRPDGIIIVKENISTEGFVVDRDDTSITRTDEQYRLIFQRAGLKLVGEKLQAGFPKQLFPVRMFALRPIPLQQPETETGSQ